MFRGWDDSMDRLGKLREHVNRTFDDLVLGANFLPGFVRRQVTYPRINLTETAGELTVECEVPGVRRDNLDVSLRGRQLTIKGERAEEEEAGRTYHRRERSGGEFNRVVELPAAVQADTMQATLKDGVLVVRLPKNPEVRPKHIKVVPAG